MKRGRVEEEKGKGEVRETKGKEVSGKKRTGK